MQQPPSKEEPEKEKPHSDGGEWEKDQAERSYYYDDSHGYVVYTPDDPDPTGECDADVPGE